MQQPSAVVLIIIDGISDVSPILFSAETPTMDRAAKRGRVGLMDPVRAGLACGSDTAHLSMFGYDPFECYRGRGAFEAMGAGMDIVGGDVAFKCNFARMNEEGIVTTRCAGMGVEMEKLALDLVQHLDGMVVEGTEVGVLYAGEHRCVVRLRGEGLSDRVSNTDPLLDGRKLQRSKAMEEGAERSARVVNEVSDRMRRVLEGCKENVLEGMRPGTNVVLLRGASEGIDVQCFQDRHGINAFLIAPTKIIAGVGKTIGMEVIRVKGGTGGYDTDLGAKAKSCVEALMEREANNWKWKLGVVHVKAVDEAVRCFDASGRRNANSSGLMLAERELCVCAECAWGRDMNRIAIRKSCGWRRSMPCLLMSCGFCTQSSALTSSRCSRATIRHRRCSVIILANRCRSCLRTSLTLTVMRKGHLFSCLVTIVMPLMRSRQVCMVPSADSPAASL